MREVTASAPGKVNLTLYAGAPTPDGYHPLVSIFEALHVRETVTVRTSRSPGIRVTTTAYGLDGSIDQDATDRMSRLNPVNHLAVRAAKSLQRLAMAGPWASTAAGLTIEVEKHVPIAGGMAGGSADAAATLLACNELWGLGLGGDQLETLARTLGADVPACLVGGIAVGTGRGDHMTPVATEGLTHYWALALADGGLATPDVFRALDGADGPAGGWKTLEEPDAGALAAALRTPEDLAGLLHNDLTDAALRLRPELSQTFTIGREAGALAVILSGSGPTIAALARDENHAQELAIAMAGSPAVARTLVTSGPAPGARIERSEGDSQ